jgi:hypothetical protein
LSFAFPSSPTSPCRPPCLCVPLPVSRPWVLVLSHFASPILCVLARSLSAPLTPSVAGSPLSRLPLSIVRWSPSMFSPLPIALLAMPLRSLCLPLAWFRYGSPAFTPPRHPRHPPNLLRQKSRPLGDSHFVPLFVSFSLDPARVASPPQSPLPLRPHSASLVPKRKPTSFVYPPPSCAPVRVHAMASP